ncbi:unnamed protein product [Sphagnum compactum]
MDFETFKVSLNLVFLLLGIEFAEFDVQPTIFSYSELRAATKDFHPDMKLGQGSYGVVYKGIFPNKNEVAVKQLFNESQQSIDEFLNEIVLITGVKHRNLVKLKGCCITTSKKRLLVYEYVENNDLEETLFGKGKHMLNWPVRVNICLGVARGLFYLHEIAQPRIIHRDIKASNILLDKNLQARIADFGLALLFPEDQTHITTMHIAGTKGYLAPEYATRGQLTEKVDVYSFGVLVLEIMSGRKNIDPSLPTHDIYLLDIAWRLERTKGNSIMNLVDCTLELRNDEMKEALHVVKIALLCLQQEPDNRPTMAHVMAMLQGEAEIMEIVLDDNLEIESMNKVWENTLSSSKINFSSISQCFEKPNVPMLKGSLSKFAKFDVQPTIFSYSELRAATKDFHPDMKLGQGNYGVVYKGIFPNNNEVAVKQLFNESQQSIDEFLNEIVLITGVKHRNLVKLKGCCITTSKKRLLVYEYVENNDLEEALFGKGKHLLNWPVRFNICLGVARGLFYLHEIAQPRIIHRDIKASNILLDKNLQARIADFGLALLFPEDQTHITTMHIAGTKGYLAPEYAIRGQLTEKVDVYSFGVLVLEVMSGRKNIDPSLPPHDIYLLDIAWRLARRKGNSIMDIVDCTLELHNDEMKEALHVVKIALLCLQQEPDNRPTMAHVVAMLQGEAEIMEIVLNDNLEIESMNKVYENILPSSKITFSSISQCFEEPNVAILKGSSSSSQIYDFASECQPFEVESFNR